MPGGHIWDRLPGLVLALIMLGSLAGCKPAAFAHHESDLMQEPPPVLTEANGYWNDPASNSFGEVSLAAGMYRRGSQICRPARLTVIHVGQSAITDTTLLYCLLPNQKWEWQPAVICRENVRESGLVCRNRDGSSFAMAPV